MIIARDAVDIMLTVHNRAEFTKECLYHLFHSTSWDNVRKLTVYNVDSKDGAREVALKMLSSFDKADWEIVDVPKAHIMDIQNFHVRKVRTPLVAKLDNDVAVPSQWLDVALSVCERYPDIGILGLSPMMGFTQMEISKEKFGCGRVPSVGGLFLAYTHVFQKAPSLPVAMGSRDGFQEWQEKVIPSVTKAWISPGIHLILMDMVPFQPWAGMRDRYIEKGWQRRGGVYDPNNPIMNWWRNAHAP